MTLTPETSAALRRIMIPWFEQVQDRIYMRITTLARASDIADDLWIIWELASSSPFQHDMLSITDVEAMELIELYARVDYREAWKAILRVTKSYLYLEELMAATTASGEKIYPRFAITNLGEPLVRCQFKDTLKKIMFRSSPMDHDSMYYEDRELLLQYWADQHGGASFHRSPDNLLPIKLFVTLVDFRYEYSDRDNVRRSILHQGSDELGEKLLKEVATMAAVSRDPEMLKLHPQWQVRNTVGPPVRPSDVFRLKSVEVSFDDVNPSNTMLRCVSSMMVDSGIGIDVVRFFRADLPQHTATSFVRTVFLGNNASKQPQELDLLTEVHFTVFQSVCSALTINSSVRHVCIQPPESDSVKYTEREEETEPNGEFPALEEEYPVEEKKNERKKRCSTTSHIQILVMSTMQNERKTWCTTLMKRRPKMMKNRWTTTMKSRRKMMKKRWMTLTNHWTATKNGRTTMMELSTGKTIASSGRGLHTPFSVARLPTVSNTSKSEFSVCVKSTSGHLNVS